MADHAKPILTDNYTDVLSQIRGRFEDQAKGFDPANTTATNISTGTIRWNSAEKKFQKWSGTTWGDLTDNYVLSGATFSTGTPNAVAYLNGSKVLTTGSALTFDGTNLGVGTAPSYAVDIRNAASTALRVGSNGNAFGSLLSWDNPSGTGRLWTLGAYDFVFGVNSTEQMRLTSTGLGIGTSSPVCKLDVQAPANGLLANFMENTSGAARRIRFSNNGTTNTIESTTGTGSTNLAFAVDGTERMRLDASGNLGLGVTPSAWGGYKAIQLSGGSIASPGANVFDVTCNAYNNSGWKYVSNFAATLLRQEDGAFKFFNAPSGTAGSTVSFTQAMTLDANGNLGVGTSSPGYRLDVAGSGSIYTRVSNTGTGPSQLFLGAGNALTQIIARDGSTGPVVLSVIQGTTETLRIDSNGKLILSAANQGIQFADGTTQTTAAILRNAVGEVGTYALLRYNGTGTVSAGMVVSSDSNRLGWSSAAGHTGLSYVPPGQLWRCMGEARDTNDAIRTTLFLRLS